jgi:nitrogen regulatory protein PII
MKLIVAIIQPTKTETAREALEKLEVARLTICDGQGFARQLGQTEMYRGIQYKPRMHRKAILEIVVNDDFLDRTIETILDVAVTGPDGNIGDGKIFVLPVEDSIRISDGRSGKEAV